MLDDPLENAIVRYREMHEILLDIGRSRLGQEGLDLAKLLERFGTVQDAVREADLSLLASLNRVGGSSRNLPRMREYREILGQVVELNMGLLSLVRTHLALVSSELAELKEGKLALEGYRLPTEQRGQMLSETY